jgi:hypothetical protein
MSRQEPKADPAQPSVAGGELIIANPLRHGGSLLIPRQLQLAREPAAGRPPGAYPRLEWSGFDSRSLEPGETDQCLLAFTRLSRAAADGVFAFAQVWGVLRVCQHDETVVLDCGARWYERGGQQVYWEPLEVWWSYAREIGAILELAAELDRGRPGDASNWQALRDSAERSWHDPDWWMLWFEEWERREPSMAERRACVTYSADKWLRFANVSPRLPWWSEARRVQLSPAVGSGITDILALQLAAALTCPRGIWQCDGCGEIIDAVRQGRRRPQAGRQHYCSNCGSRASKRRSAQRRRAQKAIPSQEQRLGS